MNQLASRQIDAAADPYRRNPGNVGAVSKGGAHDVELVLNAPDTAIERPDIELALEFGAAERGVALRINRLLQVKRGAGSAGSTQAVLPSHVLPFSRRKMKPLNLV